LSPLDLSDLTSAKFVGKKNNLFASFNLTPFAPQVKNTPSKWRQAKRT